MSIHFTLSKSEKCWNPYESIYACIRCGCCNKDKTIRRKSRLAAAKRLLQENLEFDAWHDEPYWRAIQEKNVKINIRHWRRVIRYYEKALSEEVSHV